MNGHRSDWHQLLTVFIWNRKGPQQLSVGEERREAGSADTRADCPAVQPEGTRRGEAGSSEGGGTRESVSAIRQ